MSEKADRRTILKAMATLPMIMTFGAALDYFQRQNALRLIKNPSPSYVKGACIKLDSTMFAALLVAQPFSVDIDSDRKVEGFAVKLPDGRIVAYPARCPKLHCAIELKQVGQAHVKNTDAPRKHDGVANAGNAVLFCRCHDSVFALNNGVVVDGPDRANLRPFKVKNCHQKICVIIEESHLPDFLV